MILRITKIVLKIRQYWVPLKERDDYYFKWNLLKSHIKFDIEKDLILNSLHEKYKGQIEAKFSAPYKYMRISIFSKKLFRTVDIENILNV